MPSKIVQKFVLILCLLVIVFFFYLLVFNSGYGYDATEYLTISRSLLDGYSFYSFVPSKSWGFYFFLAPLLLLPNISNHYGISILITTFFLSSLAINFLIVRRIFNPRVAMLSTILIGISGIFMEMNFLEPEGMVFIFGLLAFYCISKAIKDNSSRYFYLAGFFIGVGMAFKSTAGFYFIGALIFILFWMRLAGDSTVLILKKEFKITIGLLVALIVPTIYFVFKGKILPFIKWSYYFPLFGYPANCDYLYKLYTKLLWFDLLLLFALALSLNKSIRKPIYLNAGNVLLIFMGLFSLLSLFKTQASHYLFPAAAFLSIYIAVVLTQWLSLKQMKSSVLIVFALIIFVTGLSLLLYQPSAVRRIMTLNDYKKEKNLKAFVQIHVPRDKNALFFHDSALLYWISERYPNIPFVYFDVQTFYYLNKNPKMIIDALSDPNLMLVEFDYKTALKDYSKTEKNKLLMQQFQDLLKKNFVITDTNFPPYVFWTRKISK